MSFWCCANCGCDMRVQVYDEQTWPQVAGFGELYHITTRGARGRVWHASSYYFKNANIVWWKDGRDCLQSSTILQGRRVYWFSFKQHPPSSLPTGGRIRSTCSHS